MTRAQARAQVVQWIGLQDIADFDETAIVNDLLYQGVLDMLSRTRCVVRCVQLNTFAGQDTYTLDHGIMSLVDIEDGHRRRARRDQSSYRPTFTMIRSDVLRLEPMPSEDGLSVQTWAVLRPTPMDDDSQDFGDEKYGAIPDEFQDAIVTYALWQASDYSDDATSQQGERYRIQYEGQDGNAGRLSQIRMLVNKRGTARGGRARVSVHRVRHAGHWVG